MGWGYDIGFEVYVRVVIGVCLCMVCACIVCTEVYCVCVGYIWGGGRVGMGYVYVVCMCMSVCGICVWCGMYVKYV